MRRTILRLLVQALTGGVAQRIRLARVFRRFAGRILTAALLALIATATQADSGNWQITKLPIRSAEAPVINNSGEVVWFMNLGGGVYSSVRGKLANSGIDPRLSNSGEVVYADWFGGPKWDLVSTTRGRLTYGGMIDVNVTGFDVNSTGEVVYGESDSSGHQQVYSTIRGQITFDATDHSWPCINDQGEIVWGQAVTGLGERAVSSTRGLLPLSYGALTDGLNNLGETCFTSYLFTGQGTYNTSPHIFSSAHGVVINDPNVYQWGGDLNDAGTIVWTAPETPGSSVWNIYQAQWVPEPSTFVLFSIGAITLMAYSWRRQKRSATPC